MTAPLLDVRSLCVDFKLAGTGMRRSAGALRAVDDASLTIDEGETVALVGESGSGKSTLARSVVRLVKPSSGEILFRGNDLTALSRKASRKMCKEISMVFQDPYSSLNPSMMISDIIAEPLVVQERRSRDSVSARVRDVMGMVGLSARHLARYPHEFSGGQRQRLAIARALVSQPALVVCDEAVSALDLSIQGQVLNLLRKIQSDQEISYLFISHDLTVVRHISDRVAVMYLGRIVETGPTDRVYRHPAHPYTAALLSAVLPTHPADRGSRERIVLGGDTPSPANPPPGCKFHTRCPFALDICREVIPAVKAVGGGQKVACHLHDEGPKLEGRSVLELVGAQTAGMSG